MLNAFSVKAYSSFLMYTADSPSNPHVPSCASANGVSLTLSKTATSGLDKVGKDADELAEDWDTI